MHYNPYSIRTVFHFFIYFKIFFIILWKSNIYIIYLCALRKASNDFVFDTTFICPSSNLKEARFTPGRTPTIHYKPVRNPSFFTPTNYLYRMPTQETCLWRP